MTEIVHTINSDELFRTVGEYRFAPVRHIFVEAFRVSREQRKMMLDPMDILSALLHDPAMVQLWKAAGVSKADIEAEIEVIEAGTPKGFGALRILSMTVGFDEFRPNLYRSYMLDQTFLLALKIADDEGACRLTSHHLLAGMIRQGMNTASSLFTRLGLTQRQMRILARLPVDTN